MPSGAKSLFSFDVRFDLAKIERQAIKTNMTFKVAINVVSLQLAWIACAFGATTNNAFIGVAACSLVIALNIALSDYRVTLVVVSLFLGLYGAVTESLWAWTSVISFRAPVPFEQLAPIWIIALWSAFGGMIYPAFAMLVSRPITAALLGAIAAPWSYFAAHQFGALQLCEPYWFSMIAIAIQWAIALPTAVYIHQAISQKHKVLP